MRSSIRAASGTEQGVGSLPLHALVSLQSRGWAPFPPCPGLPPSPPPQRRGDLTHCLSLSLPQSQASRRARAPHSPTGSLLAASRDWALSSVSFFSCQGTRMESQSPLVSLLLCAWSRAPDLPGGHKRQKRASKKQGTDPGITNPQTPKLLAGDSGFCLPTYTCAVPSSGHRLSTSGLC